MSNYTADFRRFHRKRVVAGLQPAATFRKEELALVEAFERQRARTGHVRCVLDSTPGKFTSVLHAYIAYIRHLTQRDAIIVAPKVEQAISLRPRAHQVTPRSYFRILATRRLIGQILLLDTEAYCPSLPLYRSRLDAILQIALPYVCGPNSVVIIQGTSRTQKNTRFRHWLKIASNPESIYQPYGAEASSLRCAKRKPGSPRRPVFFCLSSEAKPRPLPPIPHLSFFIYPLKIAA